MTQSIDQMEFLYEVKRAMKRRFGAKKDWPLKLHVAVGQLDQLHHYSRDEFNPIAEAVAAALERPKAQRELPMDPFMRSLADKYGPDDHLAEVDAAWAILFGLSILLSNDYEAVMQCFVEAHVNCIAELEQSQVALA